MEWWLNYAALTVMIYLSILTIWRLVHKNEFEMFEVLPLALALAYVLGG